jgi:hypothetical protein
MNIMPTHIRILGNILSSYSAIRPQTFQILNDKFHKIIQIQGCHPTSNKCVGLVIYLNLKFMSTLKYMNFSCKILPKPLFGNTLKNKI